MEEFPVAAVGLEAGPVTRRQAFGKPVIDAEAVMFGYICGCESNTCGGWSCNRVQATAEENSLSVK